MGPLDICTRHFQFGNEAGQPIDPLGLPRVCFGPIAWVDATMHVPAKHC